jgi:hypothetical protein
LQNSLSSLIFSHSFIRFFEESFQPDISASESFTILSANGMVMLSCLKNLEDFIGTFDFDFCFDADDKRLEYQSKDEALNNQVQEPQLIVEH